MASNTGKPWTKKADATLRRLRGNVPDEAIANELKRTEKELIDRADELGLPASTRRNVGAVWTRESEMRLRTLWGNASQRAIRESLGRTAYGIMQKAAAIGLPVQCQGMVTIKACEEMIGVSRESLLRYMRECGVTPSRRSPVSVPMKEYRHRVIDPVVAESIVRQRDTRVGIPSRYSNSRGRGPTLVRDRMKKFGLVDRERSRQSAILAPIGVMREVYDGVDGSWCAVWRAVLAEGEMPFARWFIALAVYDTLHAEKAEREWIETVANQKALKIVADIVKKIRSVNGPGIVRATAENVPSKSRAA